MTYSARPQVDLLLLSLPSWFSTLRCYRTFWNHLLVNENNSRKICTSLYSFVTKLFSHYDWLQSMSGDKYLWFDWTGYILGINKENIIDFIVIFLKMLLAINIVKLRNIINILNLRNIFKQFVIILFLRLTMWFW